MKVCPIAEQRHPADGGGKLRSRQPGPLAASSRLPTAGLAGLMDKMEVTALTDEQRAAMAGAAQPAFETPCERKPRCEGGRASGHLQEPPSKPPTRRPISTDPHRRAVPLRYKSTGRPEVACQSPNLAGPLAMRVFCASIATETNTFSPLRTDFSDFRAKLLRASGRASRKHRPYAVRCFLALRARAAKGEIELIEGTATWAEPGGLVNSKTWDRLRNEVLDQLRVAMPVDVVILGLHGAMIADNCTDCEGVLIEAAREIAGTGGQDRRDVRSSQSPEREAGGQRRYHHGFQGVSAH